MSRRRRVSRKKKILGLVGAAALAGGAAVVMTGTSQASVTCDGLATALANNQKFIAAQQANPDANSAARIVNRQEVIKRIRIQQEAAGCADGGQAATPPSGQQAGGGAGQGYQSAPSEANGSATADPGGQAGQAGGGAGQAGQVVCQGSTVTLSGEAGAPAASSDRFPLGTKLKVTNLDNDKSTTVEVKSTSGSCVLLNNAAFEQVREPGKFLIRKARIERVG